MKPYEILITVVLFVASFTTLNAQEYISNPDLIKVQSDELFSTGVRRIQTTPFLVIDDKNMIATSALTLFIPKGAKFDEYEWTIEFHVQYKNQKNLFIQNGI